MSIEAISQIAGAFGTFIALCLVAWQVRLLVQQNRLETNSALIRWERELWTLALENPSVAPGITQALWGDTEAVFATMLIDEFEDAFMRSKTKAYDKTAWNAHERYILRCLRVPQIRQVWQETRDIRRPDFVLHFDSLIEGSNAPAKASVGTGAGSSDGLS